MATSFAKECEGIIAEMIEVRKQLVKADGDHTAIEHARKESLAYLHSLESKFAQLRDILHATVDAQVTKGK